jgi:hypothetical protein
MLIYYLYFHFNANMNGFLKITNKFFVFFVILVARQWMTANS